MNLINNQGLLKLASQQLRDNLLRVAHTSRPLRVAPRIRLVARIALVHLRMPLAGDRHGHHTKMLRGMARWGLMALRALLGRWRRVQV